MSIELDTALLTPGSHILCAVSGGADSVCLLALLRQQGTYTLSAAHYNHRLRGAESDGDEAFVRSLCEKWGIPFYAGSGDVEAFRREKGLSLETAARELRYAFLCRTAEEIGADLIATAHHANDNAETLLLRLARGTALRGLGGIPRRRGHIVRPLLSVTRQEILDYLREKELPHREDSTNALDEAARNRIRHYALPALESVNSGAVRAMGRCAEDLRTDEDFIEGAAADAFGRIYDGEALSVSGLLSLHPALQGRVLRLFLPGDLPRQLRESILKLCRAQGNGSLSAAGFTLQKSYDRLFYAGGTPLPPLPDVPLQAGESLIWGAYSVRTDFFPKGREIQDSFNTFSFASGRICGTLSLTPRREGDSIRFLRREGTRQLRRLFIDAKIPAGERHTVPVVRDETGVLAVYGFGRSERAVPLQDEPCLVVTIEKIPPAPHEKDFSEEERYERGY